MNWAPGQTCGPGGEAWLGGNAQNVVLDLIQIPALRLPSFVILSKQKSLHLSEPQFPSLEMVKKQNFLSGSWEGSGGGWILSLFPLSDGETCPSVIARKWQGGIHTQAARPPAQARPDTE